LDIRATVAYERFPLWYLRPAKDPCSSSGRFSPKEIEPPAIGEVGHVGTVRDLALAGVIVSCKIGDTSADGLPVVAMMATDDSEMPMGPRMTRLQPIPSNHRRFPMVRPHNLARQPARSTSWTATNDRSVRRSRRFRPQLERLEDRLQPSGYSVTLTSGSSTATINDNNAPAGTFADDNPAANSISFSNISFAGYTITFNGTTNTPGVGGLAFQTSNTLTATASALAISPLVISVFADGYNLGGGNPSSLIVTNSVSTTAITNAATGAAQTLVNGGGVGLTTTSVSVTGPTVLALSASSPPLITPPTAIPFSLTSLLSISDLTVNNTANISWTSTAQPTPQPAIQIVKQTNGTDNDDPPVAGTPDGPIIKVGSPVNWTYVVTADGSNEPIANVVVTDDNGTPGNPADDFHPTPVLGVDGFNVGDIADKGFLDPGEFWQYTAPSSTAQLGQYSNVATVTGTGNISHTPVNDHNPDHYFGVDAFIQITPAHPFNEVGHAETFTITVTALPGSGQLDPSHVIFSTPTITYPGQTPDLAHPATATFVSRSGNVATYSVTINSDQTGTFEVKASDAITFSAPDSPNTVQNPNPLTLTRTTGDGYVVPGNLGSDSPDAFKTWVDAFIKIAPNATNPVNAPHTFTVQVFADNGDGTGFHQVQDSEPVTETLTASNGASITQINPGSGTGLASATYNLTTTTAFNPGVTFTSPTSGTVTGHAATDLIVFGVALHRETDGTGNNSGDAVKTFVSGSPNLTITKTPDSASVVAGSTIGFTITIKNTGAADALHVKLNDPLPPGSGGDIFWSIASQNPANTFTITGPMGSQLLTLVNNGNVTLPAGATWTVHITSPTNTGDISGGAVGVQSGVNPIAYLQGAGDYAVLYEGTGGHTLSITNVTIGGNVGVGGTGKATFSGPGIITGRMDFSAANTGQFGNNNGSNVGPASVNYSVAGVTTALNTINQLSADLAGLGTPITISGNQTINESAATKITVGGVEYAFFKVTSYSENDGKIVTINGDGSGDPVVFNFSFNSNVNLGGDVVLGGNGLSDDKVIWNFTAAGNAVSLNNNASSYPTRAFHGIILAPAEKVSLVNANLNGRVFGGNSSDMQIVSGDHIHAPVLNTATVTADGNLSATDSAGITITGSPQLARGSTSQAGQGLTELLDPAGTLQPGAINVAVDLPAGPHAQAEQAAIAAAIDSLNSEVGPLGIQFSQVFGADADVTAVHIRLAPSSYIGGADEGVLGAYSADGQITLIDDWNWYLGSDANGIAGDQYDFQSVVTHELGHALGLGESSDPASAMYLYLSPGQAHHVLTANDLDAIRQELRASAGPLPTVAETVGRAAVASAEAEGSRRPASFSGLGRASLIDLSAIPDTGGGFDGTARERIDSGSGINRLENNAYWVDEPIDLSEKRVAILQTLGRTARGGEDLTINGHHDNSGRKIEESSLEWWGQPEPFAVA
jgi:uncharacterized repeat protein (TIGR01451 family)